MEAITVCSKCKEPLCILQSVQTQTCETDWNVELKAENLGADRQTGDDRVCDTVEEACKDTIHLEDITFVETDQHADSINNAEALQYAVYRDVSDEAFELDSEMELGTFAEMCHNDDEVVVLTRSFECPSNALCRWKVAANVGKAANRFSRMKKGKLSQNNEGKDILLELEDYAGLSGCRRIVVSNGRLPVSRRDGGSVLKEGLLNDTIEEENHTTLEPDKKLQSISTNGLEENEADLWKDEVVDSNSDISKEKLKRVSHVLGPNKKCLHLHEQEQHVDPGHDVSLFDINETMYNVVVVTRSFECGALSESEKSARDRWNRVKNSTKFSRAFTRFRSSNSRKESDQGQGQMLYEDQDENFGAFVGSGYRRVSMKTIEDVASLARKRNRFWRSQR